MNLLSEREREVLSLVAAGYSNKRIAAQLQNENGRALSHYTVGTYVRRVYTKLGVTCRAAAVARWMAEQHAAEIERIVEHNMKQAASALGETLPYAQEDNAPVRQ